MANLFSQEELDLLVNHPETIKQRARLENESTQVYFSIDIPESVSLKLKENFGIKTSIVPMRWFKRDTREHVDSGDGTYLVYLTDSLGQLVINDQPFPITKNKMYTIDKGLKHKTVGTGNTPRLVMGPMDRMARSVGAPGTIFYYQTQSDAINTINAIAFNGSDWVIGNIVSGSLNGITEWAIIYNEDIIPEKYSNGTDIGYAPYLFNSIHAFPASQNWGIPNVPNKSPRFNCFGCNSTGTKLVTYSSMNDFFGTYNSVPYSVSGVYISLDSGVTWHKSYSDNNIVHSIVCDTNATNIYAHTYSDFLVSNDGGNSWNSSPPPTTIGSICCSQDGTVVYYGSTSSTDVLYKSNNAGGSFDNIIPSTTGLPAGARWTNVSCNFDGSIVYLANDGEFVGGAVYKSIDSGFTWTQLSAPSGSTIYYNIGDNKTSAIQCNTDGSIINAVYDSSNYGYFIQSTDSGATWTNLYTTNVDNEIYSLSCDTSGNYLFQDTLGIIKYNTTFIPPPPDASGYHIGCFLAPNGMLFGGSFNGSATYKTTNLGVSYTNLTMNINQWTAVACNGTGNVVLAVENNQSNNSGIYISTNSGVTWTENINSIFEASHEYWNSCAINGTGNVMLVCGDDYGIIITSFNGGTSWTIGNSGNGWTGVATNSDGSKLYACTNGDRIYTCTDGSGFNWYQLGSSTQEQWSSIACNADGTRVIASIYNGPVYYSSDSGTTWSEVNVDFVGNAAWQSVSSDSTGQHLVVCATDNMSYGFVYISNDFGSTWTNGNYNSALDCTAVSGNGTLAYAGQNYINGATVITTTTSNPTGWGNTIPVSPTGNWKAIATNNDGSFAIGAMYGGPLLTVNLSTVCFLGGTKILTENGYTFIEHLKKGDLVKTLTGLVKVYGVGKRTIHNRALETRVKDQLYLLSRDIYQELKENLVITGCHSLLVDTLPKEYTEGIKEVLGCIMTTQGKFRLPACVDQRSVVYPYPGERTVYHVCLENVSDETNYGIWANGLLVESCPIRHFNKM
jgi:hypothetical protein